MTTQTLATLTAQQRTFYVKNLLRRYTPALQFARFATKDTVARRQGLTVNWRKFSAMAALTTPLTEGVTPTGQSLAVTAITAAMQQFGGFVTISDVLDFAAIDPVLTETSEILGDQAGLTIDVLTRDVVAAGTNVVFANGTARIQVGAANVLTSLLIRRARRALKRNNVPPAAGGDYIGFVHPDGVFDLTGDAAWVNAAHYAGATRIFDGELGRLWGVRFIETTNAPIWAASGAGTPAADVYGTIIVGRGAYGIPELTGESSPDIIVKQLGSAGTADPLNQRATAGWKVAHAARRLAEEAIVRIEHGVTV